MRIFNKIKPLLALIAAATLTACSTTSRIPEGETLYTGVKKIKYNNLDTVKIDSSVKDQIFEAVDVKPNNPLYSPYYRTPLPIGLWVYNHWNPKSKGLKGWLYKNLVAYPVLISRVRPQTRVEMINTLLKNNGYFDSSAGYKLHYNNDEKRKAKITYSIDVKAPYTLGEISYLQKNT
ncbi:MAG: hypothetical protein IK092_05145, partial [Muribaculaceae bacterium]|nr:hypothetical protein [Muribaculaceae bacterium]